MQGAKTPSLLDKVHAEMDSLMLTGKSLAFNRDLNLTDMETCYKMVRRELLQSLPLSADRFGIEPELTARLAQSGARIYEVPISYHGRSYEEGKKINWRDGVAALWYIARSNLAGPRPPRWTPTAVISIESEASRPGIGSGHQEEPASPGTSEAP